MVGLELGDPAAGTHDSRPDRPRSIAHCRDDGRLLLMNAGTYGNVVRFMPPLVVTEAEIDPRARCPRRRLRRDRLRGLGAEAGADAGAQSARVLVVAS